MTQETVQPRTNPSRCGAPLPTRRSSRHAPTGRRRARGSKDDWVLLPGGVWRRVETIRVRSLFG
ncbi:hypothetical protein ACWCV9_32745 [Streptomyces sp. NPDC001606]